MDGQVGNGRQSAEVSLLTLRLGGVIGPVGDQGGEVAYPANTMLGQEKPRQPPRIQPAVRRSSQGAIVQVEAVDVDVGANEGAYPKS